MLDDTHQFLYGLSSLSRYFKTKLTGFSFKLIEGSIVDIARLHEDISYPGIDGADAVVCENNREIIYICKDSVSAEPRHPLNVMNLLFDINRGVFVDRTDCYKQLRTCELGFAGEQPHPSLNMQNLLEAAALVSCFGFKLSADLVKAFTALALELEDDAISVHQPAALFQRLYLTAVVAGEYPAAGLKILREFRAVKTLWPELQALIGLDQAKEYHPEGDVWEHSLETLYHRKTADPELSFALLLHDLGKPLSARVDGNRFNNHAQLGGRAAESFLRRLEFPEIKIKKIRFLVENHMMPAAIKTLPVFRTEKAMLNPHFPLLLEVYRCDLLSSFNGPEGYYEACKVYRRFIKNTKNPFRNADGKKLLRMYVN